MGARSVPSVLWQKMLPGYILLHIISVKSLLQLFVSRMHIMVLHETLVTIGPGGGHSDTLVYTCVNQKNTEKGVIFTK